MTKPPSAPAAAASPAQNAAVFDEAWRLIDERYYDATFHGVDWQAMAAKYRPAALAANDVYELYRVINQLGAELHDRHVYAALPELIYKGRAPKKPDTGLRYRRVENTWVVSDIVPESPAERGGVQRGWLIASRDDRQISDDAVTEALSIQAGVPVTFVFKDEEDRSHSVSITPEMMSLDSVRFVSTKLPDGSRYLRFDDFNQEAVDWLNREIDAHRDAPGLILDLRNNHGGDDTALRRIARSFFPGRQSLGKVVERSGRTKNLESFTLFSTYYPGPVVVLVSGVTASSAEIFSHAMQFHRRAMIVGQQTSGAVVGAVRHPLPDGGYLGVPDIDFVGLDGRRLEGSGVAPDVPVAISLADLRARRDETLRVAVLRLPAAVKSQ